MAVCGYSIAPSLHVESLPEEQHCTGDLHGQVVVVVVVIQHSVVHSVPHQLVFPQEEHIVASYSYSRCTWDRRQNDVCRCWLPTPSLSQARRVINNMEGVELFIHDI